MIESKIRLRKKYLNLRKELTPEIITEHSLEIIEKIKKWEIFQQSKSIMLYCSHQNEVNLTKLIEYSQNQGKEVILPTINEKEGELEPYSLNCLSELISGPYGILEPTKKNKEPYKKKIDLILTPGIAFDIHGNRVGYGKRYYDKFISKMKNSIKIGIAYDFQIIKQIKEEDYDIPMNFIISEKRKINCKILTNKND